MITKINSNHCDRSTFGISRELQKPFNELSLILSQNFGGNIEHLWIDYELSQIEAGVRPPFEFRFQKRVSGVSKILNTTTQDSHNVIHYSVRPNFVDLFKASNVVKYSLNLIYQSTEILIEKQTELGGFDAELFRSEFRKGCAEIGYVI